MKTERTVPGSSIPVPSPRGSRAGSRARVPRAGCFRRHRSQPARIPRGSGPWFRPVQTHPCRICTGWDEDRTYRPGIVHSRPQPARIPRGFPGKGYDAQAFGFQLSDHFPLWLQVRTDIDGERLEQVVQNGRR